MTRQYRSVCKAAVGLFTRDATVTTVCLGQLHQAIGVTGWTCPADDQVQHATALALFG